MHRHTATNFSISFVAIHRIRNSENSILERNLNTNIEREFFAQVPYMISALTLGKRLHKNFTLFRDL